MTFKHRSFNTLCVSDDNTKITKESRKHLDGEIYYYLNIPKVVQHMFPSLKCYSNDQKAYTIDYVHGHTFSELFVRERLRLTDFVKMLECLKELHSIKPCEAESNSIDIYANYVPKLNSRYDPEYYAKFENNVDICDNLRISLLEYQNNHKARVGMIHGDPVFTNIVLGDTGNVMFIDMKGKLNDTNTVYGDVTYDWAKVYQSLIGYDTIIHNIVPNEAYVSSFIDTFWFHCPFDKEDIKLITRSLVFTLLPLHSDKLHELYNLLKVLE